MMATIPTAIADLLPELEREELDEPLGQRVEGVRAAREEQPVEDLEQEVEGEHGGRHRRR